MHGGAGYLRPRPGPRGAALGFPPPHTAYSVSNPYLQNPNPSFFHTPGNPYFQHPNLYFQHPPLFAASEPPGPPPPPGVAFPTPSSSHASVAPSPSRAELREKVERAVAKAHRDCLAAGESVSAWKVSQSALMALQIDSWSSLGFPMQDVPALYRLMVTEGKINAYIHCFVGARRITSIYDLDAAICQNEGIEKFEELGLGPLLRHPLVGHYFSVPADETKNSKISSEEIVCALAEFISPNMYKKVQAEDFLDFLAKKLCATREKLGIRLQSFGFLIGVMKAAKKTERMAFDKYVHNVKSSVERTKEKMNLVSESPEILSQKQALDKRFKSISERVKKFSSMNVCSLGKHIRYASSGSEEIGTEDNVEDLENDEHNSGIHCQSTSQNMKETDHWVSNCPYPSQSEEISRLRCQVGIDGGNSASGKSNVCRNSITKKRKFEDPNSSLKSSCKLPNSDKVGIGDLSESSNNKKQHPFIYHDNSRKSLAEEAEEFRNNRFVIDRNSMETFVGRWGRACKEHSVIEVLDKMMDYYDLKARKRRKMLTVFSSYPALGLVNVALMSMKSGLWSSCFTSLDVNDDPGPNPLTSAHQSEAVDNALSNLNESASGIKYSISAGEIIEKIKTYLELDHNLTGEGKTSLQKHLIFFKKFHECEIWLSKQFSVKHFSCFGHGEYFEFLEKYIFMIPSTLLECLIDDQCDNLLEASMSEKQLLVLLSQATHDVGENIDFHNAQISSLLKKQFPMISFKMKGNSSKENLLKIIRKQVDISSSVLFSAILLSDACKGESLVVSERGMKENFESERVGCLGSMSSSDALNCLLKAPILSDLRAWSHWDLIYAPSLGPLLEWLLTEVRTEHLACILTKDGKLIRIDPSVTVDSVMEALLIGSSYKTAVNLVSLLSLYRGTNNVPISLLKCYAVQAMDVIIKNYIDTTGTKIDGGNCMQKTMLYMDQKGKSEYPKNYSLLNEALAVASKFILDCLNQIPFEFRSYAASILLYALQSFTKDAPGIILHECSENDQLLMLHDIGLSLGIKEWIENYRLFGSGAAASLSLTTESNKACGSPLVIIKPSPVQHAIMDSEMASFEEGTSFLDGNGTNGELKENEMKEVFIEKSHESYDKNLSENNQETEAIRIIELIRKEEFGLDSNLDPSETSLLKKQHARLGRALHCLSQELYSQDSHLILELVQNADDNIYPENVEPTLIFILQATGIVVLNNEWGFSAQNIRALCDVGNSTKKGSGTGYIGQKGIGFKSVFRVTDAPEIHSNGFHVKFDLSEGQIGFVLPTVISPCDVHSFTGHMSSEANHINAKGWNTCIVLPFRSKLNEGTGIGSVVSMFSDLHPSLLLFLHRLQCIMLKNVMNDSLIILRKEMVGNGIVKVSDGSKNMNWLVSRKKLQADVIRPDVLTTEIAVAFTLQESDNGVYQPHLEQQPVFAFLPLRTYGLKFILQGDFVLPSSREEVDGDSAWNQWLLSEFPSLFTDAEKSFCGLPCYKNSPGRAVTAYMSFVPLVGEVHGFFSHLPRMIISKLRVSNCLLLEGPDMEWVPPCRVLRGWDDHAGNLLSESLLHQHLGLGYLNKDIFLSDSLAKALGVQDYGPKTLIDIISSVCAKDNGIKSLGLDWLSYWLIALSTALSVNSSKPQAEVEYDPCSRLKKIPFIPLSDGSYGSLVDGPIWLPCDAAGNKSEGEHNPEYFTYLHAKLRTVDPLLLTAGTKIVHTMDDTHVAMITRMLVKIGVQQLSAHEIITSHILPAMSSNLDADIDKHLMTDYLSFVMFHLQSLCSRCQVEKAGMILELQRKAIVLTNSGFRRPFDDSIHFSKAFGNFIDVEKLINTNSIQWHEVDAIYLKHPSTRKLPSGCEKWRGFFELLGVTDFVRVIHVDKKLMNLSSADSANAMWEGGDLIFSEMVLEDWESPELVHLLSNLSLNKCQDSCMYLVEILDKMWDDNFSTKATSACILKLNDEKRLSESSFVKGLRNFKWISSSMDGELHYPRDLFYKSEAVYSILGDIAPYAVPQVRSQLLLTALGLKTQITLNDALALFQQWRMSGVPIRASIAQMSRFYTFVWNEIRSSERKLEEFRSGPSIFLPFVCGLTHDDIVCGQLLSPDEVYWHDPTGCIERTKQLILQNSITQGFLNRTLVHFYPGLNDFFVNECGVREIPPSCAYLQIIQNLASIALPSQAANAVFHVMSKWADDIKSGLCTPEEISYLKQCLQKIENAMLPTVQDRWVSLHSSFGLVCWSDDEDLRKQFKHSMSIDFLHFGEFNDEEKRMLSEKMSGLMQALGIPALSEVISREAIFYGMEDCTEKASLVNWILPYAQRYIYVLHPSRYSHLKKFEYERLHQLQVAVVEKLYYRHTIKGCDSTTNKRFECNCLLQGNTLYVTRTSDTHSIFMELSRFFFGGSVDLQFANFLHMVTTMAESGSTEEQTEFFIVNSQKVQKLPESESTWNLSYLLPACEDGCHFANTLPIATENTPKQKPKLGIVSNWPPTNWKTAPDFRYARQNHYRRASVTPPGGPLLYDHAHITERDVSTEDWQVPTEIDDDLITADRQDAANHLPLQCLRTTDESVRHNSAIYVDRRLLSDPKTLNVPSTSGSGHESGMDISTFTTRDQLLVGLPTESQAMKIGRLGELVAYKYFVEKMGSTAVKWVNQETETGLPFDLVIGDSEENKEYIEVKATKSMTKDWFTISTREWQFAVERGNSYSVAHIILGDSKRAKVTILKNPVKLCQQSLLQLVILMQKQQ